MSPTTDKFGRLVGLDFGVTWLSNCCDATAARRAHQSGILGQIEYCLECSGCGDEIAKSECRKVRVVRISRPDQE